MLLVAFEFEISGEIIETSLCLRKPVSISPPTFFDVREIKNPWDRKRARSNAAICYYYWLRENNNARKREGRKVRKSAIPHLIAPIDNSHFPGKRLTIVILVLYILSSTTTSFMF
jgi:hypothetical protein